MDNQEVIALLRKYDLGECTEEEKALIETWYLYQPEGPLDIPIHELSKDLELIQQNLTTHIQARRVYFWPRIAAAASVIAVFCFGGYLLSHHMQPSGPIVQHSSPADVSPGGNKAILTLSNGQQIVLTEAKNGKLADEQLIAIMKTADGSISYAAPGKGPAGAETGPEVYNTITTPRGGRYDLTLSDGTEVIMDAGTSLSYPVTFKGGKRRIQLLNGQVYVKIRHDKERPFEISMRGETIRDIGTEINIEDYADEPQVRTTLVEGSISVSAARRQTILQPGEQVRITQEGEMAGVHKVDIEQVTAWKNNYFLFDKERLASVMRKVSRWYDADVVFTDESLKLQLLSGTVSRYKSLSSLLKKLELTGAAHFRIENRTVIVSN